VDNHHHCLICGDAIDPTRRTSSKVACVQRYEGKTVRCHKAGSNYIFKPGKCVETCKGYKMSEVFDNGEAVVECCQVGKEPPKSIYH
jgi:hypothetical protein